MDSTQIALVGIAIAIVVAILLFKGRRTESAAHGEAATAPSPGGGAAKLPSDDRGAAAKEGSRDRTKAKESLYKKDLALSAKTEEKLMRLLKEGGCKAGLVGVPGQLPAPAPWFIGRRNELACVLSHLEMLGDPEHPRAVVVTALRGQAGVGRTTFAVVLAQVLAERFPDGLLFLDLRSYDPETTPLTVADALRHAVQALHPEALPPEGLTPLAARYQQFLRGKRVLIVAENVRAQAAVEALVPPEGSLLVLTAREDPNLPHVEPIILEPFARPDARAFLRAASTKLGGESDKHLDPLAEYSGYLAEALRINAGRVQTSPAYTLETLCAALKKAEAIQQPVDAAVRISSSDLPADLIRAWRRLAILPGTFDVDAATAVCELNKEKAPVRLEALHSAGLLRSVGRSEAPRYEFYGVGRSFARQLLEAAEGEADGAGLRHATHFAAVLAACDQLFAGGKEGAAAALSRFDRERHHIDAAWTWARAYARRHQAAADTDFPLSDLPAAFVVPDKVTTPAYATALRLLADFPKVGAHLLPLRQYPAESAAWQEASVSSTRALGDRAAEGRALRDLGVAWSQLGEARKAISCYEEWLQITRDAKDRRGEGEALGFLGIGWTDVGYPDRGTGCFEAQLQISREIGDRISEAHALGNLGHAKATLGEFQNAVGLYEEQLKIAREIGDRPDEAEALEHLGLTWVRLGDVPKAVGYHEEQLKVTRDVGDRAGEGRALGHLGITAVRLGEVSKAIGHYEEQLKITRALGDRVSESHVLGHLGVAWARQGEVRKAVDCYAEQLVIAQETDNRVGEATARSNIGVGLERLGDLAGAAASWEKALAIYEAIESPSAETMRRWLDKVRKAPVVAAASKPPEAGSQAA